MTTIYTPTPGSAAHRVCSFFANNPGETLTKDDLCVKFDMARPSVPGLLDRAFSARYIRLSAPDQYTAGDNIDQFAGQAEAPATALATARVAASVQTPAPIAHTVAAPAPQVSEQTASAAAPALKPTSRRGGRRNALPPLDVSALPVLQGLPVPSMANKPGQGRYVELFDRLTEVGMCVQLPIAYRGAVGKAAATYCQRTRQGRKLAVRTVDANTIGVWRTA